MTLNVSEGLTRVQTTGHKVRERVGTMATGLRGEVGSVAHKRTQRAKRERRSGWPMRAIELTASVVGAATAFFVSRLVRSRHDRPGK